MKILVCGGRHYGCAPQPPTPEQLAQARAEQQRLEGFLNWLRPSQIVHGAASGADRFADEWAIAQGMRLGETLHRHAADWRSHGKAAGPKRNRDMLTLHPDIVLVLAFPGGTGTKNMVEQAVAAGVSVLLVGNR